MEKQQSYKKKLAAVLILLAMLFSLFPQQSFAEEEGTITLDVWGSQYLDAGIYSGGIDVFYSNVERENIAFKTSKQEVLPDSFIVGSGGGEGTIYLLTFAIAAGEEVEITAYDKTNPSVCDTATVTFNEPEYRTATTYVGQSRPLSTLIEYQSMPDSILEQITFQVKDESIAKVEDGALVGKSEGTTTMQISVGSAKFEQPVECTEDPTGAWYNGKKITDTLEWDKSDGETINLQAKTSDNWKEKTIVGYYESSDTSIAEKTDFSIPEMASIITFKKNGTVRLYLYDSTGRDNLLDIITIKVTGFDTDSNPEEGWEGAGPEGGASQIELKIDGSPVQNQTYNTAEIQNWITNPLNRDNVAFSLVLTNDGKDPGGGAPPITYTDEEIQLYQKEILSRINIYQAKEDGSLGEKVASYQDGYRMEDFSWSTSGSTTTTFDLAVDKGLLKKGTDYILFVEPSVSASISDGENYQLGNSVRNIGKNAYWRFTTIGGAGTVDLDRTSASLKPGETLTLTATMNKDSGVEADDVIAWDSSDPSIATVDNNGVVTAKKPGTVTIIATAVDGGVSAECTLTVEPIKSTDITLSSRAATLYVGKTLTLKATVYPADATNKTVTWSSSNSKVASVDKNGKVTAKKAGTAVITAKTADGLSTSATITVKNVKVTGVKLNAKKVTRTVGKTKQLKATVRPSNATNKGVTWTSSNKRVATVTSKGKVRAKSPGKATITVKTKDGKYKAKAVITVKPKNTSFTLKGNASSVVVKYKKRAGIDGYQIYRSEKKKGGYERVTTRTKKKGGQYTSVGVRANRTYYYKMRTYKVVKGKKIYSTFSAAKKVRTR